MHRIKVSQYTRPTQETFFCIYDSQERIRKYLNKNPSSRFRIYVSWEYDSKGRIVSYRSIHKKDNKDAKTLVVVYLRLQYNDKDELVYYEDDKGNIWQKRWQVPFMHERTLKMYRGWAETRGMGVKILMLAREEEAQKNGAF